MKLYILKRNMIYGVCNCPEDVKIPVNDYEAYDMYPDYQYVYDKLWVAQSQDLDCGTCEDMPTELPVIIRPKTNLAGMGKGTYYINNKEDIKFIPNRYFWTEVLEGDHMSIDMFVYEGSVEDYVVFQGFPQTGFTFNYWEYINYYELPINIRFWIREKIKGFHGMINIEMIGDKIIEVHLRMGDLNYFQSKLLTQKVINHYNKIEVVFLPPLCKIYLVPVFARKGEYTRVNDEDIYAIARHFDYAFVDSRFYQIDPPPSEVGNPLGGDRICNLIVTDLEIGFQIRDMILKKYYGNCWQRMYVNWIIRDVF